MKISEKFSASSKRGNVYSRYAAVFGRFLLVIGVIIVGVQTAHAQVNCNQVHCTSADQQTINSYPMFDETNFDPVVDGLGRTRKFWVHLPENYDTLNADEKMPVIFAFHGAGQYREAMVNGKWGDFFHQDIAFVIPLGEPGPCDTSSNPERVWMGPVWGPGVPTGLALPSNCDPATQRVDSHGNPVTYWKASMPDTFTDILFIENLRSIILSRFNKLNANKVYATGFSNGGGMTYSLLCYRSSLFRSFSVVANTLSGEEKRGDYDDDGIVETDANSLIATCGKSQWDAGHATGISSPNLWGYGKYLLPAPVPLDIYIRRTKPVALFVGDRDDYYTQQEIDDSSFEIRTRNNLKSLALVFYPFSNLQVDGAETEMLTYKSNNNIAQSYSVFRRYFVQNTGSGATVLPSARHAMPDKEECPVMNGANKMTCDYSYTTQTKNFFETYADLNLNP